MALSDKSLGRLEQFIAHANVQKIALAVQNLFGKFASAFCGVGISILLGLDPLPSLRGAQALLQDNVIGASVILLVVILIGGVAFWISWRKRADRKPVKNPLMRVARTVGESLVEIIIGVIAGLLLGIGSVQSSIPIIALIRAHPPIAIAIAGVLLLLLIVAPLIGGDEEDAGEQDGSESTDTAHTSSRARLWFSSATSLVSLLLLFTLFGMITIRPSWCPTSICPAPVMVLVTNRNGVNDGTLESYYLAQQSANFALTRSLSTYTFDDLPGATVASSVGAIQIGAASLPYSAVIGIHSLQRNTRYGLIIDGVDLIIDRVTPITGPTDVFLQGANLTYSTEVYTFKYGGEPAGSTITTKPPKLVIGLEVGGSDEIAVQVTSLAEVSLEFHLQVRYHQIVGGGASRTLVIPHEFAVDYVDSAHWRPYLFSNGAMIPQS